VNTEASPIVLFDTAANSPVEAELLDGISPAQVVDWEDHWLPALNDTVDRLRKAGVDRRQWPQSRHWNWGKKAAASSGLLAYPAFSVTCQGMTQGLMLVDLLHKARLPASGNRDLVYVEFLEAAPWNRRDFSGDRPRFVGVGSVLLAAAVTRSREEGFKGRIGLHSLPQSEAYYRACGMTDLGPDADHQGLRYFEMTPEQADAFLAKGATR